MNYVDFLEESAKSASVPFMEFLRTQSPDTLHMFVEGSGDIAFYRHFVLRYFKKLDKIHVHSCGGKSTIYEVRQAILTRPVQPEWADSMFLLFFVDKDLSDILEETYETAPEIFVTDFYSVENYAVTENMLGIVLTDMIRYPNDRSLTHEEIREIKQIFREQLQRFYEFAKPIMMWGIHHKRIKTQFAFSDISLNKFFALEDNAEPEIKLLLPITTFVESLDKTCKITTSSYSAEIEAQIEVLLHDVEPKTYIRGKFEMWFFHKFVSAVPKMLHRRTRLKVNYKENLMAQKDLMISLGPRVHPIPPSLARFLSENITKKRRLERNKSGRK